METLCPYCKKPSSNENNSSWPFCSPRCKTLDLGSWAKEEYRIAGESANEEKPKTSSEEDEE